MLILSTLQAVNHEACRLADCRAFEAMKPRRTVTAAIPTAAARVLIGHRYRRQQQQQQREAVPKLSPFLSLQERNHYRSRDLQYNRPILVLLNLPKANSRLNLVSKYMF